VPPPSSTASIRSDDAIIKLAAVKQQRIKHQFNLQAGSKALPGILWTLSVHAHLEQSYSTMMEYSITKGYDGRQLPRGAQFCISRDVSNRANRHNTINSAMMTRRVVVLALLLVASAGLLRTGGVPVCLYSCRAVKGAATFGHFVTHRFFSPSDIRRLFFGSSSFLAAFDQVSACHGGTTWGAVDVSK
jgi:hypothetical protein